MRFFQQLYAFLVHPPAPDAIVDEDLADAERGLLRAQSQQEWADAQVDMYVRRVIRLRNQAEKGQP